MRWALLALAALFAFTDALRWKSVRGTQDSEESSFDDTQSSLRQLIENGYRDWKAYKAYHGKGSYDEKMERTRMLSFLTAQQYIHAHNERYRKGEVSFELGLTNVADLPFSEYKKLNGYRRMYGGELGPKNSSRFLKPLNADIPDSIDWREHGYVTEVKNQGMCGSCWAFSSTGSLEGQHFRATGKLVSLSEQNLVDCSTSYGNNGCNGGLMDNAFQYIKDNHGIDTESAYPYKGRDRKCHFSKEQIGADDTGFVDLPQGCEESLKAAIATQGPVSIAIDASHTSFQMYKKGIYYEEDCSSDSLDHGVLAVGYGTDPVHGDYWIIKNSWGTNWGEQGYIRMARNRQNNCGVASSASYPLV